MSDRYKVVYGSCACGFKDVSGPQSYTECLDYLRTHTELIADNDSDLHYTDSLDIVNAETGRLMSWVL